MTVVRRGGRQYSDNAQRWSLSMFEAEMQ